MVEGVGRSTASVPLVECNTIEQRQCCVKAAAAPRLPSAMSVGKNKQLSKRRNGFKKKQTCVTCNREGLDLARSNGYRS